MAVGKVPDPAEFMQLIHKHMQESVFEVVCAG